MNQQSKESILPKKGLVNEILLKGMDEEERKQFTGSYLRSKRVLKKLHDYAEAGAARKLEDIDGPDSFQLGAVRGDYMAWCSGYRYAMRTMQKLTRT